MKEKSRRILFALLGILALIVQSCTDDERVITRPESTGIKVVGNRLSFPSSKSYFETILKVRYMTPDEFSEFSKKYQFASLHSLGDNVSSEIEGLKTMSPAYQVILNANGEVLIGDTIVWYAPGGVKHLIPNRDEEELSKIRKGLIAGKITEKYSQTLVSTQEADVPNGSISWGSLTNHQAYVKTHQYQFTNNNKTFKYVHELWNAIDGNWYRLDLVVKLEWRGASQWKEALESRKVTVNVSGGATFVGGLPHPGPVAIYVNQTQSGTLWISLRDAEIDPNYQFPYNRYWSITLNGVITQYLITNPTTTRWDNAATPLW